MEQPCQGDQWCFQQEPALPASSLLRWCKRTEGFRHQPKQGRGLSMARLSHVGKKAWRAPCGISRHCTKLLNCGEEDGERVAFMGEVSELTLG